MDSSFQRVLEESTPRTSLRQQLKLLPPQETPQVIRQSDRLTRSQKNTKDASQKEHVYKQIRGNVEATNLHTHVLRRRSQLANSSLNQSLNVSNIKTTNQTYADISVSEDSSINESINLEHATRFRRKRTKPLESASQPEFPTDTFYQKPPTGSGMAKKPRETSFGKSPRNLRSNTSLASQTYADLSLLAESDESSLSASIDMEKAARFRNKRSKPKEPSQPVLSLKPPEIRKVSQNSKSHTDKTYGSLDNSLPDTSDDSINLDGARNMRNRSRTPNVILSQPNPSVSPIISSKKMKMAKNKSPKWKSPESFSSGIGKGDVELPVLLPISQPLPQHETTYDLDVDINESLENVKAVTRQRFSRKAPAVKLNLSELMKNLQKSRQDTVQDEVRQSSTDESTARHEEEEESDNQKALLHEKVNLLAQDSSDEESDLGQVIEKSVIGPTVIPETQDVDSEPNSDENNSSDTDHFDAGDDLLMKLVTSIPESQDTLMVENASINQVSPPLNFRDKVEPNNNDESFNEDEQPDISVESDETLGNVADVEGENVHKISDLTGSPLQKRTRKSPAKLISPEKPQTNITSQSHNTSLRSQGFMQKRLNTPESQLKHRKIGSELSSPRKSVGMNASVTPVKSIGTVSFMDDSPWREYEKTSIPGSQLKERPVSQETDAASKQSPTKTLKRSLRSSPRKESPVIEGKSSMASRRGRMQTVVIEAEVHPEEAIKAAIRTPTQVEDESEPQPVLSQDSTQQSHGSPTGEDQRLDENSVTDSSPVSQTRKDSTQHFVQTTVEGRHEGTIPINAEEEFRSLINETSAAAFPEAGKMPSVVPEDTETQSEDSDDDQFVLPSVPMRKSIGTQNFADRVSDQLNLSQDSNLDDHGNISVADVTPEVMQANVFKESRKSSDVINTTSKGTGNAKQMTMKEFLQKLASKPMQMPVVAKPDQPKLDSLLKYTKTETPKRAKVGRLKAKENVKKELPKRLSKTTTRDLFSHFAKCRLSPDGLEQLLKISEEYWKNCCSDLVNFVTARKGIREVQARDIKKLMKRQSLVSSEAQLQSLIEKYLPAEEWNRLIPTAYGKGHIYPLPPDA